MSSGVTSEPSRDDYVPDCKQFRRETFAWVAGARGCYARERREPMSVLGPLGAIFLVTLGPVVFLLIFYWIIRLAVRHGVEDAHARRNRPQPESGYWDPARLESKELP